VPFTISTRNTLSLSKRLGLGGQKVSLRPRRGRHKENVHTVAAHTAGRWSSYQDHTIPTKYYSLRCV